MPSLQQLNEALLSYRGDHPDVLITVVVDATFGHRIDPREVAEFEKAIDSNEFVAPPAGAVGRGDGFILNIAQKANASILSNDSYQEFHGEFTWLFDEGRLIGGKPVPHVGWVWVNRVPVRGPISRRSVKEGKTVEKSPGRRRGSKAANDTVVIGSASSNEPMPIPKMPPPGAVMPIGKAAREQAKDDAAGRDQAAREAAPREQAPRERSGRNDRAGDQRRTDQNKDHSKGVRGDHTKNEQRKDEQNKAAAKTTNDLLSFLSFVEHYPVGTAVTGVVESYSSHGAYVAIGDAHGYVPLRLMADPAPRSAREAMGLGETVTLVVSSFGAARRSIDLAVPSMAPIVVPPVPKARRGAKKASPSAQEQVIADAIAATETAPAPTPRAETAETAKPQKPARPAKSAKSATSENQSNPSKSGKPEEPPKTEKPAKSEKPSKSEKPTKNAKPAKSARPANPVAVPAVDAIEPPSLLPVKKSRARSARSAPEAIVTAAKPTADQPNTVDKGVSRRTKKAAAAESDSPSASPSAPAATKMSAARRRPITPSAAPS